jgi:TolA-binding protein
VANDPEEGAALLLEQGLTQAAQRNAQAANSLRNFLRDFPQNSRASEAWVALAELAFHAAPPRLQEARSALAHALQAKPTSAALERADYLQIWIEDATASDDVRVIALADQFLHQHVDSAFAPEVRMKLAEAYYRRQDFANAQTQFQILAQQNAKGPLAEKALFFAAESAMAGMRADSLDQALSLLGEVVRRNGELKWAARNEQAVIERKLGKPQEALLLYNEVLKEDARLGEKREALCGLGDIYFDLGTTDPSDYKQAIDQYDKLIADDQAPPHWRNQALFKKGVCLEKMNERAAALATLYRALEREGEPHHAPEFFWFYKAGFNAARLLEEQSKWESAAALYQKLANAGGTRSDEAQARLKQLRLEHFLWEE